MGLHRIATRQDGAGGSEENVGVSIGGTNNLSLDGHGKSENKMDDDTGVPLFQETTMCNLRGFTMLPYNTSDRVLDWS